MSWLALLLVYLAGMPVGAYLALGAAADSRHVATTRGRVEVGLGGALLWPVPVGYFLWGVILFTRDVLWRGR